MLLLIAAAIRRCPAAVHLTLIGALVLLAAIAGGYLRIWPLHLFVPLSAYAVIICILPTMRKSIAWIKTGTINANIVWLIVAISLLSGIVLVGWVALTQADISHHLAKMPNVPGWCYPFIGIGFAILNATLEEAIFRGIVMDALDRAFGDNDASIILQAIPFAALHYQQGFPYGASGFVLTLIYGVLLGIIRRLSKGMFGPLVAHIAADLTIFSILLFYFL